VAGNRYAGTGGAGAVPLTSAQMMGQQTKSKARSKTFILFFSFFFFFFSFSQ